ncbi:MAG: TetR family transcriptional regulator [Actinomycetota bacterium]
MAEANRLTPKQEARRRRVIEAAAQLASEGGYDAVQMRDVATRADVALGTVYRYFSSKDQLLVECLWQVAHQLQQDLAGRPPKGESTADRVVEVIRRATRALEADPKVASALVTALASLSSEDPAGLESAQAVYAIVSDMFTEAMDGGDHPDREAVIRTLGHVWLAALITWVRGWSTKNEMWRDLEAAVRLLLPAGEKATRSLAKARA